MYESRRRKSINYHHPFMEDVVAIAILDGVHFEKDVYSFGTNILCPLSIVYTL